MFLKDKKGGKDVQKSSHGNCQDIASLRQELNLSCAIQPIEHAFFMATSLFQF